MKKENKDVLRPDINEFEITEIPQTFWGGVLRKNGSDLKVIVLAILAVVACYKFSELPATAIVFSAIVSVVLISITEKNNATTGKPQQEIPTKPGDANSST